MNAADFELNLSIPADARFADAMRDLAAHAARYAGCADSDAERYGAAVATVVRACLGVAVPGSGVPVIVRRGAGPLEFLIACEERLDAATHEGRVTVGWTHEGGTTMCRVALEL